MISQLGGVHLGPQKIELEGIRCEMGESAAIVFCLTLQILLPVKKYILCVRYVDLYFIGI